MLSIRPPPLSLSLVIILLIASCAAASANFLGAFGRSAIPRFKSSGFFEIAVDDSVGGAARSSNLCDLNNDGFADIVEVQGGHIRVRMWDNQMFSFAGASAAWTSAVLPRRHACGDVLYAATGDFDGDGWTDVVAVAEPSSFSIPLLYNCSFVFFSSPSGLSLPHLLPPSLSPHSIGPPISLPSAASRSTILLQTTNSSSHTLTLCFMTPSPSPVWSSSPTHLTPPSSLAPFVSSAAAVVWADVTGDCAADAIITWTDGSHYSSKGTLMSIHSVDALGKWTTSSRPILLPPAAASLTPVDADGDGNLDLVFVACGGGGAGGGGGGARCAVIVLFNSLHSVCSSGSLDDDCRHVCSVDAFDDGSFTPPPLPLPSGDVVTQHFAVKWLPASVVAGGSGSAWSTFAPPTVRCADVYLDGRVFFLISGLPLLDGGMMTLLMQSSPCDALLCSPEAVSRRRVVLQAADCSLSDRLSALAAHYAAADGTRIASAFFADLGGRGVLDVMLQLDSGKGKRMTAVFNNDIGASLFLKVEVRRRNCTWATCDGKGGPGVACVGASAAACMQDNNGVYSTRSSAGSYSSSHGALPPPIVFGLSSSSQLISDLTVGCAVVSAGDFPPQADVERRVESWSGLIPNSILHVTSAVPLWDIELYLYPSGAMQWILVALLCTMVVMAVSVMLLMRRETLADQQKRRQQAHLFSFDTM